ncbi:pantoate--beta-alanine ligase [Nymphaea colorata]|nr:pantoate--beta-alanine ligase [Nymphaea colorata]
MGLEPEVISDNEEMRSWSRNQRRNGETIALVPTMGFLHQGHLSLIEEAKKHAGVVVVSIYVNPGQFAPGEDLSRYPSDFEGDLSKLREVECVNVVFHPRNLYETTTKVMEPKEAGEDALEGRKKAVSCLEEDGKKGHQTWIRVEKLEKNLCGRSRPVFFRGVATVVAKLFNIVEPDFAVFGKKDYQQWRLICRMVRDLNFPINIIGSELVRDEDGLAMSSRNVHLSPEQREKALSISRSLLKAKVDVQRGQTSATELRNAIIKSISQAGGRIDYAEVVEQENLEAVEEVCGPVVICIAAWFGNVRLIDNLEINS